MPERTTPGPEINRGDIMAIRDLISQAAETCRYHGDRLTRFELMGGVTNAPNDPCCGTGQVAFFRRRAAEALDRIERAVFG